LLPVYNVCVWNEAFVFVFFYMTLYIIIINIICVQACKCCDSFLKLSKAYSNLRDENFLYLCTYTAWLILCVGLIMYLLMPWRQNAYYIMNACDVLSWLLCHCLKKRRQKLKCWHVLSDAKLLLLKQKTPSNGYILCENSPRRRSPRGEFAPKIYPSRGVLCFNPLPSSYMSKNRKLLWTKKSCFC